MSIPERKPKGAAENLTDNRVGAMLLFLFISKTQISMKKLVFWGGLNAASSAGIAGNVMETGDHSKNGACPKSHTSKGILLLGITLCLSWAVFLSSCEKAAPADNNKENPAENPNNNGNSGNNGNNENNGNSGADSSNNNGDSGNSGTSISNYTKILTQIEYAADGVTESSKYEYTYDSQGRQTGLKWSSNGQLLTEEEYEYTYDSQGRQTGMKTYSNGRLFKEYTYDSQGRETGCKQYDLGQLILKYRDYVYNGKECTYFIDSSSSASIPIPTYKCKITYYDNELTKILTRIEYAADGVTEGIRKTEYTYDSQGRQTGCKAYFQRQLFLGNRDYVWNGKECTFFRDVYYRGSITSTSKFKIIYY